MECAMLTLCHCLTCACLILPSPSTSLRHLCCTAATSIADSTHSPHQVALRDYYRSELSSLLNLPSAGASSKDKKALVLDKTLSGPLGLVAEVALLQAHGVDQIHHLKDLELQTPA